MIQEFLSPYSGGRLMQQWNKKTQIIFLVPLPELVVNSGPGFPMKMAPKPEFWVLSEAPIFLL